MPAFVIMISATMRNKTCIIHLKNLLYPRSVHTLFQGLSVVFGLLFYIPSGSLTEHLAFPPLMALLLCGEWPITSVGRDFRPSLLHLYYTIKLAVCQGVLENFFNFFRRYSKSVRCIALRLSRRNLLELPPLTLILYHNEREKSIVFWKKLKNI